MVDTPERVKLYATLLNGATPTVGYGGARYLHLCRGHYTFQHHALFESGIMSSLYRQDLTVSNKTHIRFARTDLELTNMPAMDRAIDWAAGILPEVQKVLPYPTAIIVHHGLVNTVADYRGRSLSKTGLTNTFAREAERLDRSVRFLLFEWIRQDVVNRAPAFIKLFDSNTFLKQFGGYAETVLQMYQLATDRPPIELPFLLEARQQRKENELAEHQRKLHKLGEAYTQQLRVVEELTNPYMNMDGDTLRAKPVSLPRSAGVVHPDRVILPVGNWQNKGKDITATEAVHDDDITYERARIARPWESRKRHASTEADYLYEQEEPELTPVIGPVLLREPGEREHKSHARLTKAAKRTLFKDGVIHVAVANQDVGSCSKSQPVQSSQAAQPRRMTQDEVEEAPSNVDMEDHFLDHERLDYEPASGSEMDY